jgi:ethanolamine utilization protein EutQ (cupin superfamily)
MLSSRTASAKTGDTIFLPKDTQLHYESTGKAKLLYIVNPEGNVRWRLLVDSD